MREPERAWGWAAFSAGVVFVLIAASIADVFPRHGWSAAWYADRQGERMLMARSTEHRVGFPNEQRVLARYVQRWDYARLGMPNTLPPIDATLSARLRVPEGGRLLAARSTDHTALRIDGRALGPEERVGQGWHRLDADWSGPTRASSSFEILWGQSPGSLEAVPREALVPALEGSWAPLRVGLWLGAVALALLLGWQLRRIVLAVPAVRSARIGQLATALLVLLALSYRVFDYDVMPDFRENDDERFATWNGFSLLEDGTTRGLTMWWQNYLGADRGTIERPQYFDRSYHCVTPYFEHPPLLHVLVGLAGHLGGARSHVEVPLAHARLVPIALSIVTLLLMLAVGRRLEPRGAGPYLGALLWSALPWIALQTRVVKEEALLTPLALGSVLAFLEWRDRRRTRDLVIAAVLAGLCPLTKVTGLAFLLALLILVTAEGTWRHVALTLGAGLATASLLLVYGAVIDWDAFAFAQGLQTSRAVHFNIFLRFFDDALINHNIVGRGWIMFLWLAALAGLPRRSRRDAAVLAVPLVTYLATIALGSGTWTFGWYVTPLLPFLCLGAGRYLAELWQSPDLLRGGIFVFVLVFYSLNFVLGRDVAMDPTRSDDVRRLVTVVLGLGLAPFALAQGFGARAFGIARTALVAGLAVVVFVGAMFVVRYETLSTSYHDFDRDRNFDR